MEHVLRTENLTKTFGDKEAVSRVSMTIKKGDIYGFIGKNGAGKTTLMRLVLGVARPDSGEIELFDGENLNSARHRIGSLLENPCLYKGSCRIDNSILRCICFCSTKDNTVNNNKRNIDSKCCI